MKQSAVEYLIENLIFINSKNWDGIVEQAKEMEKQQQGYSEEEVLNILREFYKVSSKKDFPFKTTIPLWFEKFKNK